MISWSSNLAVYLYTLTLLFISLPSPWYLPSEIWSLILCERGAAYKWTVLCVLSTIFWKTVNGIFYGGDIILLIVPLRAELVFRRNYPRERHSRTTRRTTALLSYRSVSMCLDISTRIEQRIRWAVFACWFSRPRLLLHLHLTLRCHSST